MCAQMTFQRYELKYLLTPAQKESVFRAMQDRMQLDQYGRATIRNIYLDTANFRLVRRSLERPAYKEKIRIRSYKQAGYQDPVFVELKKKYQSVVYKRRISLPQHLVMESLETGAPFPISSQIGDEIQYFRQYYQPLYPAAFLSYEREAYYPLDNSDFRITFDENILYRQTEMSLDSEIYGTPILGKGQTLMEIKTSGGIPLWMTHVLTQCGIHKSSFSKYGTAYQHILINKMQGELRYA